MTEYFNELPLIQYDMKGDGNTKLVNNLLLRVRMRQSLINETSLFNEHDIIDGETPEIIAFKMYGSTDFHWVIMIINNIINPLFDWPLTQFNLSKFVDKKYDDANATHHYRDNNLHIVNSDAPFATAVTNFVHESEVNEKNISIKILKKEFLTDFSDEYKSLIKSSF